MIIDSIVSLAETSLYLYNKTVKYIASSIPTQVALLTGLTSVQFPTSLRLKGLGVWIKHVKILAPLRSCA